MTTSETDSPKTIITCDEDDVTRMILGKYSASAGFEVVAEATDGIELERLVTALQPDAVLIRHELTGIPGATIASELMNQPGAPRVILVSPDPDATRLAKHIGAFGAINPTDPETATEMIEALREKMESGEKREPGDRRVGADRRIEQDWSKVFSQRRSGSDRRQTDRRNDLDQGSGS